MKRRQIRYRLEDLKIVREYTGENGERIVESAYPDGTTVTSCIPRRTPEEAARREAHVQEAVAQFARAMVCLRGYEWARERLEAVR